ncbi:MAG: nucleotide pyrophosphohydrolase [bacterium]
MQIKELTEKALRIQEEYRKFEDKKSFKHWDIEQTYDSLVSDVGDLGRLVLAKEGFRDATGADKNLEHELAEILWATLVLAEHYKIDLESAYLKQIEKVEQDLNK